MLLAIKRYLRENWFPTTAITLITFLVWHKLLLQVPTGEGYFYFDDASLADLRSLTFKFLKQDYCFLARIIFGVLIPIFKDNLGYYMLFELVAILFVYQTLYFITVKISKDRILSFLTTIFFLANYVGSFTMIGINYQRFIQRVPNLIPIFISLYFLNKYLQTNKFKNLCLTLLFYAGSIILAHFNAFLLPIFAIYPFVYALINKQKITFIKAVFLSIFFVVSSILLTRGDSLSRPDYSPLIFIKETPQIAQMIFYQISSTVFPQQVTEFLSKKVFLVPYPHLTTQNYILVFLLILFVIGFLKGRKYPNLLAFYVTLTLSLFAISFMTIYAYHAIPDPTKIFQEDRIYFVHSILTAFIWATLVKFLFGKDKKTYKMVAIIVGIFFLITNTSLIWKNMDDYQYRSNITKAFIGRIKSLSSSFNDQTVLVAPADVLMTTSSFIRRFYNLEQATFITFDRDWKNQIIKTKADGNNVYIFDYRYFISPKGAITPSSVEIIDQSGDYRSNKKVKPLTR